MRAALVVLLAATACSGGPHRVPPVRRAPEPSVPRDAAAPSPSPPPDAGPSPTPAAELITDEECIARGGTIETEQTWAHERRDPDAPLHPYRICRIPSPQNGHDCRGDEDCGIGRCFCTGELGGPDVASRRPDLRARDGTPATGTCSDHHLPSGSWFCLVENGRVMLHGIIID